MPCDILNRVNSPSDLKKLNTEEKKQYADGLRDYIIRVVSENGGHLSSNLGVVELTIAIHSVFNSPYDKIVWDVSHQSYAHKIITGRREAFNTLRCKNGISGFTNRDESIHDNFTFGHAGVSISAALGLAKSRDIQKSDENIIAVIGDGSIGNGTAVEALNNIADAKTNIIIILNDNKMSISKNVGALAAHFSKLRLKRRDLKRFIDFKRVLGRLPYSRCLKKIAEGFYHGFIRLFQSQMGVFFEEIGLTYLGPFDGNNIEELESALVGAKKAGGPVVVHVCTKKGLGYRFAEDNPNRFHGIGSFNICDGDCKKISNNISFTQVFSKKIVALAESNDKICAITAGMPDGTGLCEFENRFPDRFYDVGIAEGHALSFAGGLAAGGMRPVVAIYSTFLQRAYDNIIHDICLQNLPVVIAVDRSGLVGEDGPTHHGVFDIAFLRHIPNISICAPRNDRELEKLLDFAFVYNAPIAIRYPRGDAPLPLDYESDKPIEWGKSEVIVNGDVAVLLCIGAFAYLGVSVAAKLADDYNISLAVCDMRFVKPIDKDYIKKLSDSNTPIFTLEDGVVKGGFGSCVLEVLSGFGNADLLKYSFGVEDAFVTHGNVNLLRDDLGLTVDKIANDIFVLLR